LIWELPLAFRGWSGIHEDTFRIGGYTTDVGKGVTRCPEGEKFMKATF